MSTEWNANDHRYADTINRISMEYAETPGGAPPGVVVKGVLVAQEGDHYMSTGETQPQGEFSIPLDSEDAQFFIERYGREPNLWMPEDSVHVVVNGVNERQEMGNHFSDWHAAAFGFTGALKSTGSNTDFTKEQQDRAGKWYYDYAKSMSGESASKIDAIHPGTAVRDPKTKHVVVTPGGEMSENPVYKRQSISDMGYKALQGTSDWLLGEIQDGSDAALDGIQSGADSITDSIISPIIESIKAWAPRVMLFVVGAMIFGFGVYRMFRG